MKLKIGVAMPVCVQIPMLCEMTFDCLQLLATQHELRVWMTLVRPPVDLDAFRRRIDGRVTLRVRDVSVAGAWNWGFRQACAWKADRLMILANDVLLQIGRAHV